MARDPESVIAELVGAPWRVLGRDPETGLDCLGLVIIALRRMGIPARDAISADPAEVRRGIACDFFEVPEREARPGDVVMFHGPGEEPHVGIRLKGGVAQATHKHGVIIAPWCLMRPIMRGTFRHREAPL